MLHICYSNRLEVLLAPLLAQVDELQRQSPLGEVSIVTPNRAVEQYISLNMADQLGIAGNLHFYRLGGFIRDVVNRQTNGLDVLETMSIQLLIFDALNDVSLMAHEDFAGLRQYFDGCATEEEWVLRALQMSGELARLFEEYSFSRTELLMGWQTHKGGSETHPMARWQRRLYQHVFGTEPLASEIASSRKQANISQLSLFTAPSSKPSAQALLFPWLLANTQDCDWPENIFIFGLSYVAPSFVRFFDLLSERTTVNLYTLNPCYEYWEDAHKKSLKQLKSEQYSFISPPTVPLLNNEDSPALNLWGRPGREYLKMLNELDKAVITGGFIDPLDEKQSLLNQIQHDILLRQSPKPYEMPRDNSIGLIESADRRSEVEAAAIHIRQLLDSKASLNLRDVTVLICEDHKHEYLAHIEAVFWQRYRMPYNTVDRSLESSSQVIEYVRALLELGAGRFRLNQLEKTMSHPLAWSNETSEREVVKRWFKQMKPAFLLEDQTESDSTYFGGARHGLKASTEQFLANTLCGPSPKPKPLQTLGLSQPIVSLSEMEFGLEFYQRLSEISEMMMTFSNLSCPLQEWSVHIDQLLTTQTFAKTSVDEYALEQCLGTIRDLANADVVRRPIPFSAVLNLMVPKLEALAGGIGQLLASGVIVSSLLPMRILPSKVMVLMGLGTGSFPGTTKVNPLDLRQIERRFGDVYDGERDRYLFLESLLSAREHFLCTFVGVHPTSGEAEAPSAVVEEFCFILERYLGSEGLSALRRSQPVLPWNADAALLEGQPLAAEMARSLRIANLAGHTPNEDLSQLLDPLNHPSLDGETALEGVVNQELVSLPVRLVTKFLKTPLQASAQVRLGLYQDQLPEQESDREPLTAPKFDLSGLASECFWTTTTLSSAIERFETGLHLLQEQGRLPFGVFFEKTKTKGVSFLEAWWQNADAVDLGCPTDYQTVRLGDGRRDEQTDVVLPPILLRIDSTQRQYEIQGTIARVHKDGRTLAKVTDANGLSKKAFVDLFMSSVCLAAVNQPTSSPSRLVTLPNKRYPMERLCQFLRLPNQVEALSYLRLLVEELTQSFHDYRLPIEAVLKFVELRERSPTAEFYVGPREVNADIYGPIRNPEVFSAPTTDVAEAAIAKRFGPWFGSEV